MADSVLVYLAGLVLGFGLITPIGAQNVFVIGQGLALGVPRALWAAGAAACCDTALIVVGSAGVAGLVNAVPEARAALLLAGAAFLTHLGIQGLRRAGRRIEDENEALAAGRPPRRIVGRAVTVSLLNPHAILDTVGVIGAAALAQPPGTRLLFAGGAISASWIWFVFLAVGAAVLRPHLTPRTARLVDQVSAFVMLACAGVFAVELAHGIH